MSDIKTLFSKKKIPLINLNYNKPLILEKKEELIKILGIKNQTSL